MTSFTTGGHLSYRTKLMERPAAERFCRALNANSRFTNVTLVKSDRAKTEKYFVSFLPANTERQAAMVQREQDARAERAATQQFTFVLDESRRFFHCLSHSSGMVYNVTERTCDCPDSEVRLAGTSIACKHRHALAAADQSSLRVF